MLAHDLQRPFDLIETCLKNLSLCTDPKDFHEFREQACQEIQQSSQHVAHLMADILQFQDTEKPLEKSVIFVNDLITLCKTQLAVYFPNRIDSLEIQDFQTTTVSVHPQKMTRVLCNLLTNAFEATKPEHRVWIHKKPDPQWITLVVGNSGCYLDPTTTRRIMEPFYTQGKVQGTGLGLAIAHKIVTLHQGQLLYQSHLGAEKDLSDSWVECTIQLPI